MILFRDILSEAKEVVVGGKADNLSLEDIAKKHGVSYGFLKQQFTQGMKIESEHTSKPEIAKEIAKDHLFEDPKYYIKLKKVESN